jgi:hypothetical protein
LRRERERERAKQILLGGNSYVAAKIVKRVREERVERDRLGIT